MKKLTTLFIMSLLIMFFPVATKAAEEETQYLTNYTTSCTINGVERTLTADENGNIYLTVGTEEPLFMSFSALDMGFDKYGIVWILDSLRCISWFNYDLHNSKIIFLCIIHSTDCLNPETYIHDVECLIFDDQGFVTGYKTTSGETYPILTLDEMKTELDKYIDPTPSPTVEQTSTPTSTPEPTQEPTVAPTLQPTVAPTTEPVAKVSIKKKSGFTAIYSGNSLVHKYKLKKGVLTWTWKKTKKIKMLNMLVLLRKVRM